MVIFIKLLIATAPPIYINGGQKHSLLIPKF